MDAEQQRLQVLRTLDKQDRIDTNGIVDLLTKGRVDQSGAFTEGCGLNNTQAVGLLGLLQCVNACFNPDDKRAVLIANRFALMDMLESKIIEEDTGRTAWDHFLDEFMKLPEPRNIAWVLDDLAEAILEKRKETSEQVRD